MNRGRSIAWPHGVHITDEMLKDALILPTEFYRFVEAERTAGRPVNSATDLVYRYGASGHTALIRGNT